MRMDLSELPPGARRQAMAQIAAQEAAKAKRAVPSGSGDGGKVTKYHNQPDARGNIRFDSKKEAARYDELMLLLKAGKIRNLKLQPQFTLQEAYTTPEGKRVQAIRYVADFTYEEEDWDPLSPVCWRQVVEDVKSRATKTRVYEMKKKLMREKFGIEIREV